MKKNYKGGEVVDVMSGEETSNTMLGENKKKKKSGNKNNKTKKSNGHKSTCCCPIYKNMKKNKTLKN